MVLTTAFGIWLYFFIHLFAIWGFFWILRVLVAPFIREILQGVRIM